MTVCIESGIDCEFKDNDDTDEWHVDKLIQLEGGKFLDPRADAWCNCRPRMNHIHASPTGWDKCPLPEGFVIKFWDCDGTYQETNEPTKLPFWGKNQITMFQVTGIAEGYEL